MDREGFSVPCGGGNRSILPSLYLWGDYVPLEGGLEWESRLLVEAG